MVFFCLFIRLLVSSLSLSLIVDLLLQHTDTRVWVWVCLVRLKIIFTVIAVLLWPSVFYLAIIVVAVVVVVKTRKNIIPKQSDLLFLFLIFDRWLSR